MTRRVASILPCLAGSGASLFLLLTSAPSVSAQGATSATLRAAVTDPSGAALPGAAVVLTNVRTTAVRTGTTDRSGGVVFAGLVAGTGMDSPLALTEENALAVPLSIIAFTAIVLGFYAWTKREAATASAAA